MALLQCYGATAVRWWEASSTILEIFLSKLYLVKVVEVVEVVVVGTVRGSLDDPGEVVGVLQRPQEVSSG